MQALQTMTGQSILLSEAIAQAAGLNITDLEALATIQMRETTSAGDLAKLTGLTTGAVTTVIDRLERQSYIRRVDDPADRRKVLLQVQADRIVEVQQLYADLETEMSKLVARYAPDQIDFLIVFLRECTRLTTNHISIISARREGRVRKKHQTNEEERLKRHP
jgi:DNA-binding MarR family transcriptional regulator